MEQMLNRFQTWLLAWRGRGAGRVPFWLWFHWSLTGRYPAEPKTKMSKRTIIYCAECGNANPTDRDTCGVCKEPLNGPIRMEECLPCMAGDGPCAKHGGVSRHSVYDLSKRYIRQNHWGMSEQTRYAILQFAQWVDKRSSDSAGEKQS